MAHFIVSFSFTAILTLVCIFSFSMSFKVALLSNFTSTILNFDNNFLFSSVPVNSIGGTTTLSNPSVISTCSFSNISSNVNVINSESSIELVFAIVALNKLVLNCFVTLTDLVTLSSQLVTEISAINTLGQENLLSYYVVADNNIIDIVTKISTIGD